MNNTAFVRIHRFQTDFSAQTNRFRRKVVCQSFQRFFSVFAVVFAIYHHALIIFSADVRHGARQRLRRVQHHAFFTDQRIVVRRRYVDDDFFVLGNQLRRRRYVHNLKQPVQKFHGSLAVRLSLRVRLNLRKPLFLLFRGGFFVFRRRFRFAVIA